MTVFSSLLLETLVSPTLFTTVIAVGCVVSPFLFSLWRSFTPSGNVAVQVSPLMVTCPSLLDKTVLSLSFKRTSTTLSLLSNVNPPNVPLILRVVDDTASWLNVGFGGATWNVTSFSMLAGV